MHVGFCWKNLWQIPEATNLASGNGVSGWHSFLLSFLDLMVPHKDAVRQWWCVVFDVFWATFTSGWGSVSPKKPQWPCSICGCAQECISQPSWESWEKINWRLRIGLGSTSSTQHTAAMQPQFDIKLLEQLFLRCFLLWAVSRWDIQTAPVASSGTFLAGPWAEPLFSCGWAGKQTSASNGVGSALSASGPAVSSVKPNPFPFGDEFSLVLLEMWISLAFCFLGGVFWFASRILMSTSTFLIAKKWQVPCNQQPDRL